MAELCSALYRSRFVWSASDSLCGGEDLRMVCVWWCLHRVWVGRYPVGGCRPGLRGGLYVEACPLGRSGWGWGVVSRGRRVCDRLVRVPEVVMWQCRRGRDAVGVV